MKVVLFCGGLGMRLREYSETVPKPMVRIGLRPILWHVMKYYAHFGHRDFVLCLGWKAQVVKEFFLNYSECLSNDFVYSSGGQAIRLLNRDIEDWKITFVDTGTRASIGERLKAVEPFLAEESCFLANYADGLTDLPLTELIEFHRRQDAIGTFLAVRPKQSFHAVTADRDGFVKNISPISDSEVWMNGGYFVLDHRIFDYLHAGEDLVDQPFRRLIAGRRLAAYGYDGFWCCMDTYKEMQALEDMAARGDAPWEVWKRRGRTACPDLALPVQPLLGAMV